MVERNVIRVLVVGDDADVIEDFRHLLAPSPPSRPDSALGRLEDELFTAGSDHEDFPEVDLVVCRHGGEAVKAVRHGLGQEDPFAVVCIDMRLAAGLDWIQTAEQIRAWDPRAQLVMMAARSDVHPMDISARVPPADRLFYVQKPFHALEIKQLVYTLSAKWQSDGAFSGVRRSPFGAELADARDALAAIQHQPIGTLVFDQRDTLLAANPEFFRLFPQLADILAAGMSYEEVLVLMAERLLPDDALYAPDTWVRDRLDWHGQGGGVAEQRFSGDLWTLLFESASAQDMRYCHYIDVSAVKQRNLSKSAAAQMTAMAQAFAGLCERFDLMAIGRAGHTATPAALLDDPQIAVLGKGPRLSGDADAEALAHKLLAVAQRLKLDPQPADLNTLVAATVHDAMGHSGRGVAFEVVEGAGLWEVLIDPGEFAAALRELVKNAAEAMIDGGRVVVETTNTRLTREFVAQRSGLAAGEYVRVSVQDDGPGMTVDLAQRALNPFFTSQTEGRHDGLGLSVAYGFVSQSGGYLEIAGQEGEGTRVDLYFPRSVIDKGTLGADVHVVATKRRSLG